MRYGEKVSFILLQELAYYSTKLNNVEKKLYGAETYKGKAHIWVEALDAILGEASIRYVIYGSNPKTWFAEYFDWRGNYLGMVEDTEPFDYKTKEAEMKK